MSIFVAGFLWLAVRAGSSVGPEQPGPAAAAAPPALVGDVAPAAADPSNGEQQQAYFPGVRLDYLSTVRDDTVFRNAESDAWFHLLDLLARTDPAELARASLGRVGFLQLDDQSASYRGRVVTVGGTVRAAKEVTPPANAYGIKKYYQLWIQPERSDPELIAVYSLELPHDFPLGAELDTPATTTGFYFKRWAYQSQGGISTVPLILSRTVDWQPPPPPRRPRRRPLNSLACRLPWPPWWPLALWACWWSSGVRPVGAARDCPSRILRKPSRISRSVGILTPRIPIPTPSADSTV